MPHGSRPTLAAVAKRAGVSASTASLAFNASGPVSDATRVRVLAAAQALNYAGPDPRARSLRRGRSGIVGVVVEERVRDAFHDPIKIAMLDGLAEELGAINAGLLLLADAGEEASNPSRTGGATISDSPMDAVVLVGCSTRFTESLVALECRGIPIVSIEGARRTGIVHIGQDNRESTRRGAHYLRELGHTRVGVVTLPLERDRSRGEATPARIAASNVDTATERLAGAHEVFPDARAIVSAGSYVDEGMRAARTLFTGDEAKRPTAIIAQSDLLAAGVIRAAEEMGIAVPEQLSVLGFDGVQVDGLQRYDLATLVQPAVEKGRAAGQAVVKLLQGEDAASTTFSSTFHQGNTTAPPAD